MSAAGLGAYWARCGYFSDPRVTAQTFLAAAQSGDVTALAATFGERAQGKVSPAVLRDTLAQLPELKDPKLPLNVSRDPGMFSRRATLNLAQGKKSLPTLNMSLAGGQWAVNPAPLLGLAAERVLGRVHDSAGKLPSTSDLIAYNLYYLPEGLRAQREAARALVQRAKALAGAATTLDPNLPFPKRLAYVGDDLSAFDDAIAIASDNAGVEKHLADASRFYDQARFADAIAANQVALDANTITDGQRGRADHNLAFAFRDFKSAPNNMDKAIDAARAATLVQPSKGDYWCTLGDLLRQYTLYDEAINAFNTGIGKAAGAVKADCLVWRGLTKYIQEDIYQARADWRAALTLEPTNTNAKKFLKEY